MQTKLSAALSRYSFALAALVLFGFGVWLYSYHSEYPYLSAGHLRDLMWAKCFALFWVVLSAAVIYLRRERPYAPRLVVLAVSIYFVVLYGILFKATQYGMNGHWGDNGNRLAEICKMMAYSTFWTDWYIKDLPSFYPPLWFFTMAIYAKLLGIEAYQTIKFGYLLIFVVYPWALYYSWKRLIGDWGGALVVLCVMIVGYRYLDWIYYEHITASLFIPWWLYYLEDCTEKSASGKVDWQFYLRGSLFGGLLAMTYYYWFFMAIAAAPLILAVKYHQDRNFKVIVVDIRHKLVLASGVALVSAVYWAPLVWSVLFHGLDSAQNVWFGTRHTDLVAHWESVSVEAMFIYAGVFSVFYFWTLFGKTRLAFLYLGSVILILVDRIFNQFESSFQSRKIIEFVHVFLMAPAGFGLAGIWPSIGSAAVKRGLLGVGLLVLIVVTNQQTEEYKSTFYRNAVNQRVPTGDIEVFRSVDYDKKVFLTDRYIEACYVPYYMFVNHHNMVAHTASQLNRRLEFLKEAAKIKEPDVLAYALRYNRYCAVDYVYLPINAPTGQLQFIHYRVKYMNEAVPDTTLFAVDPTTAPELFVQRHPRSVYELKAAARDAGEDSRLQAEYPAVYGHLSRLSDSL